MELNLMGVKCPISLIRTRQAIQKMKPGETLTIKVDDPAYTADIKAYCLKGGHALSGEVGRWLVTKG
jgi:tRNA 2-thiouridine synthesizing protein A